VTLDVGVAGVFLLALARTSAWVVAAPVFGARGTTAMGRLALALALSLFLAPIAAERAALPSDVPGFVVAMVGQIIVGLLLGWATGLVLHAFEAAGSAIDLASGFSVGALIDPINGNSTALFARFSNLLFVTLLFATNGHQLLVEGFVRSFDALPADQFPVLGGGSAMTAAGAVGGLMVAALEIGAPVLGALFLTEVALALASRFAPQANVFLVGLPLKVLIAFVALGGALVFLPGHLERLVAMALRTGAEVIG
jgi:flagellar biosynthetic protein FliR